MRLTREAALCLQRWMTSLLPELHDWREVGNTGGGKGPVVKSAASHATPVPVTPDHMPPCAAKPCHSSFPLGKQRPLSGQSLLWSCRAEAICSSWLLTVKWPSLFLVTALLVCATLNQPGSFYFVNFLLGPVCLEKGMKTEMSHPLKCLWQCIFSVGFDLRGRGSWSMAFEAKQKANDCDILKENFSLLQLRCSSCNSCHWFAETSLKIGPKWVRNTSGETVIEVVNKKTV